MLVIACKWISNALTFSASFSSYSHHVIQMPCTSLFLGTLSSASYMNCSKSVLNSLEPTSIAISRRIIEIIFHLRSNACSSIFASLRISKRMKQSLSFLICHQLISFAVISPLNNPIKSFPSSVISISSTLRVTTNYRWFSKN